MLSISNISAAQAGNYYKKDGYYVRNDSAGDTWQGKLKSDLNLPDEITKEHFDSLIELRKERAGFDLCFSAPKSVSVALCLDDSIRKNMIEAHEAAVAATLVKIEDREIGTRITTNGKTEHIKTDNMLCGKFNHYVSRNSDPQLHTHAVILNQTLHEGNVYAVDNANLYRNKMLYGQIYRNTLAAELMQRGYEVTITDSEKGFFELSGFDQDLLDQFSSRRTQILNQLKEWGLDASPENAAQAALTTRKAKEHRDMDLLIKSWKETVEELGGVSIEKKPSPILPKDEEKLLAYEQAVTDLSQSEFAFTEKALQRRVLAAGVSCAMTEEDYFRLMKADQELIHIGAQKQDNQEQEKGTAKLSYYTTRRNLKVEQHIFQEVVIRQNSMISIDNEKAEKILQKVDPEATLSSEQRQAVLHIAQSKDQYMAVQGLAGTGKTYMLNYAREVLEHEGYTVKGACFTGKAADGLQNDAKIPSVTLHSHLNTLEKEAGNRNPLENFEKKNKWNFDGLKKSSGKEVWIVDEASLVDNSTMYALMGAAKRKDAKVVFIGDEKQLPPVGVGNAYGTMVQTKRISTAYIQDIMRQRNAPELLQSVKEAVNGDIEKSFKLLDKNIHEISKPKKRFNAIINEYLALTPQEQKNTVILTAVNKDRTFINQGIREFLKQKKLLPEGTEFELTDKSGRKITREFASGDKIIFLKNDKHLQVKNGQTGIVESCNERMLTIRSGDRSIIVNTGKYKMLDHGYAMTAHKAQGITVDRALIQMDSKQAVMNTRNAYYVDISRARHAVKIFTDDVLELKKQVKDFAKKITSENFSQERLSPKKSLYHRYKKSLETVFKDKQPEQVKTLEDPKLKIN